MAGGDRHTGIGGEIPARIGGLGTNIWRRLALPATAERQPGFAVTD